MTIDWKEDPELVKVFWDDAVNLASWQCKEDMEKFYGNNPQRCFNVGYLIGEDETGYYVSARHGQFNDQDDAWGLIERLPKGMVTEILVLKEHRELLPRVDTSMAVKARLIKDFERAAQTSPARMFHVAEEPIGRITKIETHPDGSLKLTGFLNEEHEDLKWR